MIIMFNKIKKFIALGMVFVSVVSSTYFGSSISEAAIKTSYYKKSMTVTFNISKGIKKVTINNKRKYVKVGVKKFKYTFKKQGRYSVKITDRSGKVTKKMIVIDKTKPTIDGVTNGVTYAGAVTFTAKDNFKLASTTVNDMPITGTYTVSEEGTYTVIAIDKAGNKKTVSFFVVDANATAIPTATSASVTNNPDISNAPISTNGTSTPSVANTQFPTADNNTGIVVGTQAPTEVPNVPKVTATVNETMLPEATPKENNCSHAWNTSILSESTCEMDGIEKSVCSICGETKFETIPMTGHDYSLKNSIESYEIKKPTCTDSGVYYYACKNCGKKSNITYEVPKLGHNYVEQVDAAALIEKATCLHGARYYKICSHCHILSEEVWTSTVLENHQYNTKKVLSEATETTDVSYELCCDTCGKSDGRVYYEDGTHLDTKVPHVYGTAYLASLNHTTYSCVVDTYYHDVMYEGNIGGRKYEYYTYLPDVVQCTDPLGISFHAGAVDEESGIKQYQIAMLNVTKEEIEDISRNDTQAYVEQLISNYLSTGLMMSNAQNISIGTYVSMLAKSGTYEYMYILVEDMAGNITVVSTEPILF